MQGQEPLVHQRPEIDFRRMQNTRGHFRTE